VDGGEAVHAETEVAGRAHDHQREHDHRREHRTADADLGELLQRPRSAHGLITTGCPVTRLPGSITTGSPDLSPSTISTRSFSRRPVTTRRSWTLPSRTVSTFSMPAKITMDEVGTKTAGWSAA